MTTAAENTSVHLYLLGQTRVVRCWDGELQDVRVQPKLLRVLAYLALNRHILRREVLQALFWPDKPGAAAANNLRQALWHLQRALPPGALQADEEHVGWNPALPPWVDALAFEAALDVDDIDAALALYAGPLLPGAYDEWAQLERERLHLRYQAALEARAQRGYERGDWPAALADAEQLLSGDPLNETAVRLVMACHWALDRREAARRSYEACRRQLRCELQADPLPETTALHQRILRGEPHPARLHPPAETDVRAREAHLSLLETLGAFRQGLDQAAAWAAEAGEAAQTSALLAAQRWRGRFHLRLGQLDAARAELAAALSLPGSVDARAAVLADLATVETARGEYPAAAAHYAQALQLPALRPATRMHLLSGAGGLQGRLGHLVEARASLEEAVRLARAQADPAPLAIAGGNLGILLTGQGEAAAAEAALQEALDAARRADAHWLTAHLLGHLGVLAQDRQELERAATQYQGARVLAETIGDSRAAALWTLNLGVVRYEQGLYAEALPLLEAGQEQAAAQGSRSLEAGALIFAGACRAAQGQGEEGLAQIQQGLDLARALQDRERVLMGQLHKGRVLAVLGRSVEACAALQEGLDQAVESRMHRLERYLRAELERVKGLTVPDS